MVFHLSIVFWFLRNFSQYTRSASLLVLVAASFQLCPASLSFIILESGAALDPPALMLPFFSFFDWLSFPKISVIHFWRLPKKFEMVAAVSSLLLSSDDWLAFEVIWLVFLSSYRCFAFIFYYKAIWQHPPKKSNISIGLLCLGWQRRHWYLVLRLLTGAWWIRYVMTWWAIAHLIITSLNC